MGIKEIKEIHKRVPNLELECFIHGALCMAYSGRCFLSKFFTERNANLGDCIQPCRWKYRTRIAANEDTNSRKFLIQAEDQEELLELAEEEHGSYILNFQDLCLIKKLDKLKEAGINAFKIEGRAKSVYYLATVVERIEKPLT